jgi:ubiquinol-cytochrome c reductase cytochrome b subunit
MWNLGSFLGMALAVQILTGVLLLLNYNTLEPFDAIQFIMLEVNLGWLLKLVHSNNARIIFVLLYLHQYKNISVFGYRLHGVWNSGVIMILLIMGAAFTGYVLVGRQIRFWAAMVITRLLGVVPLSGERILYMA